MSNINVKCIIENQPHFTFQIILKGLVQGIGFRPFVYQLANQFGLNGQVTNGSEGVEIKFNANAETAESFYQQVLFQAPQLAQIQKSQLRVIYSQDFTGFSINESISTGKVSLLLTPDFGMCSDCRKELHNKENRRYRYPFITCTNCGPRYSIISKLPYDRPQTTMEKFTMCPVCEEEYQNPNDRRFYAQTNACDSCGPKLGWFKSENGKAIQISELYDSRWILSRAKLAFQEGKIIAVKGIGGYLLMCDATNEVVVNKLRKRKNRPSKPFAVLFSSLEVLEKDTLISKNELEELQSNVAPIVLLKQRKKDFGQISKAVNPKLNHIGAMLPYAPLLDLLANDFGKPLVATSGNISGSPIIFEDEKALEELSEIADYMLTHNREILIPQDDSVVRFSEKYQQKIIIRRGRGELLAVNPISRSIGNSLSFGASLKSTFSIKNDENLYTSQYLGDLESFETQQNFTRVLNHFSELFENKLEKINLFCDLHEGYFSTQLAKEVAKDWNLKINKIQHHEAHFSAVLAENNLHREDSLMGVIWDGTGLGTDGNIWGGEFFINHKRVHFEYFDAILGDKMPKEPRISSFCLAFRNSDFEEIIKPKFTSNEWNLYQKILRNNSLKTSSVGRIFDGVASILGLSDRQSFEGEVAMLLEELAGEYFQENGYNFEESYFSEPYENIPTFELIKGVLNDIKSQKSKSFIAAKFHFSLVDCIKFVAKQNQIDKIAFSGGVLQNAVLVDLIIHHLQLDFRLFFHNNLSPNDENISFGQMCFKPLKL